ncbi:MAG TPA: AMP-binding protein [Chloroflexota bacterium]|nr:AMP-binding protein [Chloroflexota bacterium]
MLIGDILRRQAAPAGRPEKAALLTETGSVTFAQLYGAACGVARCLTEHGIRKGDRVALLGRNSAEWVAAYYGAALCGAVLVPLNFWYRAGEVAYVLEDSGATLVLVEPELAALVGSACETLLLGAAASVSAPSAPDVDIDERDPHIILYTSGTTGFPKGAVLSHRAHVLHALTFALHTGAHSDDVYLNVYPLFHTGGTDCAVLPYHFAGATVGLLRDPKPEAILNSIERWRVTAMMAVPTIWRRLVDSKDVDARDLTTFRRAMGSSDAMPRDLLEEVMRRFNASWTQTYGLTEAGCILTYLPPADHTRKIGSAGKPHAQADLFIADPTRDGDPAWPLGAEHRLPNGQTGEVVARTEHAMTEYWGKPQQTAAALRNGHLRSGDLGYLDDEGYLFIAGRLKDVIISGGEKIYPAEVEPQLRGFPGVRELALVGVPDREWGESVLAAIVSEGGARIDAEDFKRWARARVAGYKTPKHVALVDELPRTTGTGKVQKAVLRERFKDVGSA